MWATINVDPGSAPYVVFWFGRSAGENQIEKEGVTGPVCLAPSRSKWSCVPEEGFRADSAIFCPFRLVLSVSA